MLPSRRRRCRRPAESGKPFPGLLRPSFEKAPQQGSKPSMRRESWSPLDLADLDEFLTDGKSTASIEYLCRPVEEVEAKIADFVGTRPPALSTDRFDRIDPAAMCFGLPRYCWCTRRNGSGRIERGTHAFVHYKD
jgi:hypothetical protein